MSTEHERHETISLGRGARPMRTTRQGTFDGLCGVYAILNALDPAGFKRPRGQLHAALFKELTYGLGSVSLLSAMHPPSRSMSVEIG